MKKRKQSSFSLGQSLDIMQPHREGAFPIPVSDWRFLRSKIDQLKEPSRAFNSCGSALLGVSASSLVASLTFPSATDAHIITISWSVFAVSVISGILCLVFDSKSAAVFSTVHKREILDEMDRVENRFKDSTDSPAQPAASDAQPGN